MDTLKIVTLESNYFSIIESTISLIDDLIQIFRGLNQEDRINSINQVI